MEFIYYNYEFVIVDIFRSGQVMENLSIKGRLLMMPWGDGSGSEAM